MSSSTEMLEYWRDNVLPMLKEKDFRGNAERMAYNAYLEGCIFGGSKAMWHEDTNDESILPPYDEEVIALVAEKDNSGRTIGYRIAFAHRPDPDGWDDGKSILRGKPLHSESVRKRRLERRNLPLDEAATTTKRVCHLLNPNKYERNYNANKSLQRF